MKTIQPLTAGVVLCAVIAIAAKLLSAYLPFGAVAIAILLGMIVGNSVGLGARFAKGITFSEKQILAVAIALMGVNLNYAILRELGYRSILLIVTAIGVTIGASLILARVLRWNSRLALLLGIGNGVCGTSAIAATEGIIGADEEEVGLSIAIVNFLGVCGMLLLPLLGTMILDFTDIQVGILIGNTLQAVGQVTAAGFSVGEITGQTATIVKMGRILMLTPLILILIALLAKQGTATPSQPADVKRHGIPLFIVGFLLFSLLATFRLLPDIAIRALDTISDYALIIAMAGIGLKITFDSILRDGKTALLVGSAIFLWQIVYTGSAILFLF